MKETLRKTLMLFDNCLSLIETVSYSKGQPTPHTHTVPTSSPKGNDAHLRKAFLNSSQVSKRFFSIGQGQLTQQSMAGPNSDVNQGSLLCCKFAKI